MTDRRYERNLGTIGEEGQKKLKRASVAIIGAGGLGGYVLESLARVGFGKITIVDHDKFDETNLNRQILSKTKYIGTSKVDAAKRRIAEVNPDVELVAIEEKLSETNAVKILGDSQIVCDCIDRIPERFIIEKASRKLGIPMIHAAIAGREGQVLVVFPGDKGLEAIYGGESYPPARGMEAEAGTPPTTAALVGNIQAEEAIRIIINNISPLRGNLLRINLDNWKMGLYMIP